MPLNIVEPNLEKVKPELHGLYVKDAKSGKYHLQLSDLKSYVEERVSPIENELKIAQENERKLSLSAALHKANIDPHYEELVLANISGRVALGTFNNKRGFRITDATGRMPMVGSGDGGLATLDDLVKEAVKEFPSMFKADPSGKGGMPAPVTKRVGKVLTRSAFDKLQPVERSQKIREGYQVVDDQAGVRPANRPSPQPGDRVMTREAFEQLSPSARSDKVLKEGFKVVD